MSGHSSETLHVEEAMQGLMGLWRSTVLKQVQDKRRHRRVTLYERLAYPRGRRPTLEVPEDALRPKAFFVSPSSSHALGRVTSYELRPAPSLAGLAPASSSSSSSSILQPPEPLSFLDPEIVYAASFQSRESAEATRCFGYLQRIYDLFAIFDKSKTYERSVSQKQAHDVFVSMICFFLFRKEFERCKQRILEITNRTYIPWMFLLKWTRRNGKTISLEMFVAIMLHAGRGIHIGFFTHDDKLIEGIRKKISEFLYMLPGDIKGRMLRYSKNLIEFTSIDEDVGIVSQRGLQTVRQQGRHNVVEIWPINMVKGQGYNLVICDEAGTYPREFFSKTMGVLINVEGTGFILASTVDVDLQSKPGGTPFGNWCTRDPETGNLRDPEMELSEVILVCDECKKQNPESFQTCPHNEYKQPHWKLSANMDRLKVLMDGDMKNFSTDVLGLGAEDGDDKSAFSPDEIRSMESLPQVALNSLFLIQIAQRRSFLVTYVDPGGGGTHSDTAFVTLLCSPVYKENKRTEDGEPVPGNHFFVAGLESMNLVEVDEVEAVVQRYFEGFLRSEELRHAPHFVFVEKNYGGSPMASMFLRAAKIGSHNQIVAVNDDEKRGAGLTLTASKKQIAYLETKLCIKEQRLRILDKVVTGKKTKGSSCPKLVERLIDQLRYLKRDRLEGKSTSKEAKDDMAVSLMMAAGWCAIEVQGQRMNLR